MIHTPGWKGGPQRCHPTHLEIGLVHEFPTSHLLVVVDRTIRGLIHLLDVGQLPKGPDVLEDAGLVIIDANNLGLRKRKLSIQHCAVSFSARARSP